MNWIDSSRLSYISPNWSARYSESYTIIFWWRLTFDSYRRSLRISLALFSNSFCRAFSRARFTFSTRSCCLSIIFYVELSKPSLSLVKKAAMVPSESIDCWLLRKPLALPFDLLKGTVLRGDFWPGEAVIDWKAAKGVPSGLLTMLWEPLSGFLLSLFMNTNFARLTSGWVKWNAFGFDPLS